MNEIKKCPFCGGEVRLAKMNHGLSCRGYEVKISILCDHCNLRFGNEISEYIVNENGQTETIKDGASKLIERWNKRAEEPHKESRVEQILKRTIFPNKPFCTLAYNDKHGKGCKDLDCCECEFNNVTETAKYLLAPYEGKDDFVAVSDLISKTQSSANEILETLRANAKEEK